MLNLDTFMVVLVVVLVFVVTAMIAVTFAVIVAVARVNVFVAFDGLTWMEKKRASSVFDT